MRIQISAVLRADLLQELFFEQRFEPIGKDLQSARQMLPVRIKQSHWHGFRAVMGHNLNQLARFQVTADVIGRDLDKPEPCQAAGDVRFRAIHGDPPAQRRRATRVVFDPLPVFDPPARRRCVIDCPMMFEIV